MGRFVFLAVLAGMALSSLAFGATLEGTVLNAAGEPVAGAAVWLTQNRIVQTGATASDGTFRFKKLPAGFATLVAWKEGLACGGLQGIFVEDGTVTITLPVAGQLTLRVLSDRYEPVAGARIKSMFVNSSFTVPVEMLVPHGFPSLRSDDNGMLLVPQLPADVHVQLLLTHLDYAEAFVAYLPVDEKQHEIVLEEGVLLKGRVTRQGVPVAGALVSIDQLSTQGPVHLSEVTADPEGFYSLRLPPATYLVVADHQDYAPGEPQEVVLQAAAVTVDLVVNDARTLSGTVVDRSGKGASGIPVEFRRKGMVHEQTITRGDGRFELKVGYGEGTLVVQAPAGYFVEPVRGIEVDMKDEREVKLSPVTLERIPAVMGTVMDESGAPLPNAAVTLIGAQPPLMTLSDERGEFRFQLDILGADSNLSVRAEHPTRFLRAETEVDARKDHPLHLKLKPFEPDQAQREAGRNAFSLKFLMGEPAPPLTCDAWFNADPLTLDALKGKVIVLTFWGG
ncbi:MAG: carboxypeptidase regulatory-like domain-containing protein, partial [Candidatus Hydrogenedentes bacterium]|nr:carboxypeptidase regulatory-like domain-containing protein [Candidatus Hydrogenedentota bacterium]